MVKSVGEQVAGKDIGLPNYSTMKTMRSRGIGLLYKTYDSVHRREITVRVASGQHAAVLTRAFEQWVPFSTHENIRTAYNLVVGEDINVVA